MDQEIHYFKDGNVVVHRRENSDKWQARIKLPTGKWKKVSTKQKDFDAAVEWATNEYDLLKLKIENNIPVDTRRFKDVAKLAVKEMQKEIDAGYGKASYRQYIRIIGYYVEFFGNKNVTSINHQSLQDFDQWRTSRLGRRVKASTINSYNAALARIFDLAVRNGWMFQSQVVSFKNNGAKGERRPAFSLDEYRKLTRAMRGWCDQGRKERTRQIRRLLRDYVLVLANTGIRHGTEAMNIKWQHIREIEHQGQQYIQIHIAHSKVKNLKHREVIARHNVRNYLKRLAGHTPELQDLSWDELLQRDEYVFRLPDGSEAKDLHGAFETCLKEVGLLTGIDGKHRTLYSLRHTYATFAILYRKTDFYTLALNMRTSVAMIEEHYSHIRVMDRAEELAGKVFAKGDRSVSTN